MSRKLKATLFRDTDILGKAGLTEQMISDGVNKTYEILDALDKPLLVSIGQRLAEIVELANLSTIIGNIIGAGVADSSGGAFERNGPHKFPDLLPKISTAKPVEIKISLEDNKPKGHLPKEGYYLTFRYALCPENGVYVFNKKNRGTIVWVWEARFGYLNEEHFNISNTPGDSGKTAVVNALGMKALKPYYCDLNFCPYSKKGAIYRMAEQKFGSAKIA